jgi:hypothetical protein
MRWGTQQEKPDCNASPAALLSSPTRNPSPAGRALLSARPSRLPVKSLRQPRRLVFAGRIALRARHSRRHGIGRRAGLPMADQDGSRKPSRCLRRAGTFAETPLNGSTALVQKIGDCGEDYESWPEKTGLQAVNGPVPVIFPQSGIRLIETRPAPQPRGSGFFVDPGQTGTPAQSHAGEMEPTSWTRMLSAIFTMAVAACAIYIILFEM